MTERVVDEATRAINERVRDGEADDQGAGGGASS